MRVGLPPVSVPVYLATLSPKMLALTGEIADGWLGTSFIPEQADAYLTHLDEGLARAVRAGPGPPWTSARAPRSAWWTRPTWPRTLASRGSPSSPSPSAAWARPRPTSTTTPTAARAGPRSPPRSATRWQAGDRDGAAALVTDEMVLATTLIGTEDMVRARLRAWRDAGVDTVRLYPAGDTPTARLDTLARGIDLVRAL